MPALSRLAIRASLLYFMLGSTFGGLLLWNKGIPLEPAIWSLRPLHVEFMLFGWMLQLVIGVAYWILPRHTSEPKRGHPLGAWGSLLMLNLGILLVGLSGCTRLAAGGVVLGRFLELGGALGFALNAWPRIRKLFSWSP